MRAISLPFSTTLLCPQNLPEVVNNRCTSVISCTSTVVKSQLRFTRGRGFGSTGNRIPNFSGNVQSAGVSAPTSVPVRVAHELLQAGHHYLDVRTPEEFSAGHVTGAVNVPFLLRLGAGMTRNPKFLEEVLAHFSKDDEIIVGCQLGKRSLMAASELLSAGFTGITDMAGGYDAWLQNGLPTE